MINNNNKRNMKNSLIRSHKRKRWKRQRTWSRQRTTTIINRSLINVPLDPISRVWYKTIQVKTTILPTRQVPFSQDKGLLGVVTEVTVGVMAFTINPIMMMMIPDIFSLYY